MKQAMELLEQAALEYDHPMALVQLGNMRLEEAGERQTGEGKSKDLVLEALDLYRRAGEKGSRVGWYNFGNLLWTGYPVQAEADDDLRTALDRMFHGMEEQLRRAKEKRASRSRSRNTGDFEPLDDSEDELDVVVNEF